MSRTIFFSSCKRYRKGLECILDYRVKMTSVMLEAPDSPCCFGDTFRRASSQSMCEVIEGGSRNFVLDGWLLSCDEALTSGLVALP